MHELTIIRNLLTQVLQVATANNLSTITQIKVSIGCLRQVVPEMLEFAFQAAAKHTIAAPAILCVNYIPVQVSCNSCKTRHTVTENIYWCPTCNSPDLVIVTGKEIILESIQGTNHVTKHL